MPKLEFIESAHGEDALYDENTILCEQGYYTECEKIEEGEIFEVPRNYIGKVNSEKELFILSREICYTEKIPANGVSLYEGEYVLEGDLIKRV